MFSGDVVEDMVQRRVHQVGDVVAGNGEIRRREGHFDVGQERSDELPVSVHVVKVSIVAGQPRRFECGADTEPAGDDLAGLSPSEHPRDGSEVAK